MSGLFVTFIVFLVVVILGWWVFGKLAPRLPEPLPVIIQVCFVVLVVLYFVFRIALPFAHGGYLG